MISDARKACICAIETILRRRMEEDTEERKNWVQQEVACTEQYFERCTEASPATIKSRMEEVYNYEKLGTLSKRGEWYYFSRRTGLQNQSVIYRCREATSEAIDNAETFLDINLEYPKGTTAIRTMSWSDDGSMLAYTLSHAGSDWQTAKVRRASDKQDITDVVPWIKHSGLQWKKDNSGFFYTRYPLPRGVRLHLAGDGEGEAGGEAKEAGTETDSNENNMVFFHKIGTAASEDRVLYRDSEHPRWMKGVEVSDDGNFLLVTVSQGCEPENHVYYADMREQWGAWWAAGDEALAAAAAADGKEGMEDSDWPTMPFVKMVDTFDAAIEYVTNDDRTFFFMTNRNAPRNRIVRIDLPAHQQDTDAETAAAKEAHEAMHEVLPEQTSVLESAYVVGENKLLCTFMEDVCSVGRVYSLYDTSRVLYEVPVPAPGCIAGLGERRDQFEVFFGFDSMIHPRIIYRLALPEAAATEGFSVESVRETVVPGYDPNDFESWQEFATSEDGTKFPMFLTRKKPSSADGDTGGASTTTPRPCVLYGYGGFNISLTPWFSPIRVVWLQNLGGMFVVANIRGGGEYGDAWHKAGLKLSKKNCFADFAAAARHLVERGWTTQEKLGIMGGSNGGLLVLACMLQYPDLFRAVVSQVAVTDMLRYHKFTIGHAWISDFGDPEESREMLDYLLTYSPLHNVQAPAEGRPLPAALLTTADHDDRVVPLHTFKMLATLQTTAGASPHQVHPLLGLIEVDAGHGAGKPTSKILDEAARTYSFVAHELGAEWTS